MNLKITITTKSLNIEVLSNILLSNPLIKEEIRMEIRYLELNKNAKLQKWWDSVTTVLRGEFIALSV